MNIFNELKKYILPYYPIFEYKGQEIYNAIFENWGATAAPNYYMFSDRLRNRLSGKILGGKFQFC